MSGRQQKTDDPLAHLTPAVGSPTAITEGHVIAGRYEIGRRLGKGGMGVVHLAQDRMLDEPVALKLLRQEVAETPGMDERFRSEIKLARRVTHRNVCRIYEYGEDGGVRYISMELIEGSDLKDRIDSAPEGLPMRESFSIAMQISEGLEAIHEVGIIHRDLKTPNIMIDARGRIRLMDFGIAKQEGQVSSGLTQQGLVMGTPEYMSPEQCRGHKLDQRSDIYSLGVVLFEVFSGLVPFQADTPMDTVLLQVQKAAPLDGPEAVKIPKPLRPVLSRMLAKDRDARFANVAAVLDALRRARSESLAEKSEEKVAAEAEAEADWPDSDRRSDPRLEIHVNAVIRRVGADGRVVQEERTIAENISRGGAQVMTSMAADVQTGDVVIFEELEGEYSTRAEVRNIYRGEDNVHRINLKFIDRRAPDRLVRTDSN